MKSRAIKICFFSLTLFYAYWFYSAPKALAQLQHPKVKTQISDFLTSTEFQHLKLPNFKSKPLPYLLYGVIVSESEGEKSITLKFKDNQENEIKFTQYLLMKHPLRCENKYNNSDWFKKLQNAAPKGSQFCVSYQDKLQKGAPIKTVMVTQNPKMHIESQNLFKSKDITDLEQFLNSLQNASKVFTYIKTQVRSPRNIQTSSPGYQKHLPFYLQSSPVLLVMNIHHSVFYKFNSNHSLLGHSDSWSLEYKSPQNSTPKMNFQFHFLKTGPFYKIEKLCNGFRYQNLTQVSTRSHHFPKAKCVYESQVQDEKKTMPNLSRVALIPPEYTLEIKGKNMSLELFRRLNKALIPNPGFRKF